MYMENYMAVANDLGLKRANSLPESATELNAARSSFWVVSGSFYAI